MMKTQKPNLPYGTPALTEILGDLLDSLVRIVPPPKPKPKPAPKSDGLR